MSLRLRLSEYSDKIGEAEGKLKLERIKVTAFKGERSPPTTVVMFRNTRSQRGSQEGTGQSCSTMAC